MANLLGPNNKLKHIIDAQNISYSYGNETVVENVTFKILPGDFVALVGPNGSGKSTLIKLLLGLIRPSCGNISLFETDVEKFSSWEKIGYVPQIASGLHANYPMTAGEAVALGEYKGFDPLRIFKKTKNSNVENALDIAGIPHLYNRRVGDLSTGQQQRVLFAKAIVKNPEVLILDEAIAGVDLHGEEQVYSLLRELNEQGVSILIVSHDIGAVIREAKTCCCINRSVVFHGSYHTLTKDELATLYGYPVEVLLHDALHEHR